MQIETKTRMKVNRSGVGVVILDVLLVPRGSGNRSKARKIAAEFKRDARLKDHVIKVVAGASRVTVHLRGSIDLMRAVNEIASDYRASVDVPGQMKLFAVGG